MEQQFAGLGRNAEQELQDEIAGDDVKLNFVLPGKEEIFFS